MTSSHSYITYNNWSNVPPLVGSGIVTFIMLAFLITVTIIYKCNLCDRCRCSQYFVDPFFRIVKVTFGDHIKKVEGSQKFTLYGYEISLWRMVPLSTITIMIFWPTFMSFWVSFIANETFVCDPQLDCFLRVPYSSSLIVFFSDPLVNCSSYGSTNGAVVCFEFVFDLTEGFSSAVGFMAVAVVYCRLYTFIMIWLREFCSDKCQMNCTRCVSFIMILVISIIHLLIVSVVNLVPFFRDVVLKTNKSTIIFHAYMISFFYVGPLTSGYVTKALRGARKPRASNNAQVTSEEGNRLLGASVNQSNYTNLPQDT